MNWEAYLDVEYVLIGALSYRKYYENVKFELSGIVSIVDEIILVGRTLQTSYLF